jgi:hypothetical protein
MNEKTRDLCKELFIDLQILPLHSQYIFSLSLFVVKNKDQYKSNHQIHSVNTRYSTNNFIEFSWVQKLLGGCAATWSHKHIFVVVFKIRR